MLITSNGVVEAPNNFTTMADCQAVVKQINFPSYCVEKTPVDPQKEMSRFLALFKQMQREFNNER